MWSHNKNWAMQNQFELVVMNCISKYASTWRNHCPTHFAFTFLPWKILTFGFQSPLQKKILLMFFTLKVYLPLSKQPRTPCSLCLVETTCHNPNLGLVTKARGWKVAGQEKDLGVQRVWGNEPSHSQVNSHVGSWSPKWTFESSERDCRGQNPLPWGDLYIIENLLKFRCLKWACIAHLNIWNTSYGQKKGRSQIGNLTPKR
jgi:hypothetical protein